MNRPFYFTHCLLLIIILVPVSVSDLCGQYRILLMLPLFLINKCSEAVTMADIACISLSHLTCGCAGHWTHLLSWAGRICPVLWCRVMYGAQWARSLVILILSVSHSNIL